MIRQADISFPDLQEEEYDSPMGTASGAGAIFGSTGGVLEAAVRTACHLTTGKEADLPDYEELRGFSGLKEAEVLLKDRKLKVAIAHGTGNARVLLERLRAGETFHFVEIMACPGGCVGGGGQPIYGSRERKEVSLDYRHNRADALGRIDATKTLRRSHENPDVLRLYKNFWANPWGKCPGTCFIPVTRRGANCPAFSLEESRAATLVTPWIICLTHKRRNLPPDSDRHTIADD